MHLPQPTGQASGRSATADRRGDPGRSAIFADRTFEALVFDWDGTAVPDRAADAGEVRHRIEALCAAGVHVFVVSGTHVENVDGQLGARPHGPGRLHLCCNRGSEVFEVTDAGPVVVFRRTASAEEDSALDQAAAETVTRLEAHGLVAQVVSQRLNRRKIDLIPVAEWADPRKSDIDALAHAVQRRLEAAGITGLADVVTLAQTAARAAGLTDPRVTSDVKHVEIGLTDKSDSAVFATRWLAERGITGGLVLIVGDELGPVGGMAGSDSLMMIDALARAAVVSVGVEPGGVPHGVEHLGGGPARLLKLFDAQLARRNERRVPHVDPDPAWVLVLPSAATSERVAESLGALANGQAGTRAAREEDGPGAFPLFVVNGTYSHSGGLLPGPVWTGLDLTGAHRRRSERRLLDMRTAVLLRSDSDDRGLRSIRFMSAASPHAMALRAEGPAAHLDPGLTLRPPRDGRDIEYDERAGVHLARTGHGGADAVIAARDRSTTLSEDRVVERLAAWVSHPVAPGGSGTAAEAAFDEASRLLAEVEATGFDALLAEHREAWARRWADAEVVIEGDEDDELSARFSVFHLLCAVADEDEAAVGARGLTGDAYSGHVFWDADVFVLPALAALRPAAARAMLEYRIRRLPTARAAARSQGLRGARFPWESAGDGTDVTPRWVTGPRGEHIPIVTGVHEEHIVSDVAWAATRYAAWTGDTAFLTGAGRDLVVDTARYWASRVRRDLGGVGHLYGVEGPDEYHPVVDDNAYTNVMARWNLRRGADLLEGSGDATEAQEAVILRDLAESLVDGWDPERGLYEQFAGYFALEPLLMSEIARPPAVVDVLLGADRVAGSQLIKQADVLMLHHLVPEEVVPGSLGPCLSFYEPRTAHGSSLSPPIYASLLARAGLPERALELFRLAARLDMEDITGTTSGGIHLATMGGVWQALAYGFLGLRADPDALAVAPCLPQAWSALSLRLRFRGHPIGVRAEHDRVVITCDTPLSVRVGSSMRVRCEPPGRTFPFDTAAFHAPPPDQRRADARHAQPFPDARHTEAQRERSRP